MSKTLLCFLFTCMAAVARAQNPGEYLFWHLGTDNGLLSDEIIGVQQDQKGYLWIATLNGLQRYDGRRFTNFRHIAGDPHSIPTDRIIWQQLDKKDRLWMVFGGNRVGYMNTADFVFHEVPIRYNEEILKKTNNSVFIDNGENVYLVLHNLTILTYNERLNEFSESFDRFRWPEGWGPTWFMQDKQQGNYWFACIQGLAKFNPHTNTLSYRGHNTDQDPVIKAFEQNTNLSYPFLDKSGRFWLVSWPPTKYISLMSFNPATGETRSYVDEINRDLKGIYLEVHAIVEQGDSSVWVMGHNLFARLGKKDNHFQVIPDNLPGQYSIRYDGVRSMYEDKEHNLWASTTKGLYRFNPSSLLFHAITNKRYGRDSLFTPDVNDVLHTRDGQVLIATWGNGIFSYDKDFNPISLPYVNESHKLLGYFSWCLHQRSNGDIWEGAQDGFLFIMHPATGKCERLQDPAFGGSTIRQIAQDGQGHLWLGTQRGLLVKWDSATGVFSKLHRFNSIVQRLYTDRQGYIWAGTAKDGVYKINTRTDSIEAHYAFAATPGIGLTGTDVKDIVQYNDSLIVIASDGLNILNTRTGAFKYFTSDNGMPSNTVISMVIDKAGHIWAATENGICSINFEKQTVVTYAVTDGVSTNAFNIAANGVLNDGRILFGTAHNSLVFDPAKAIGSTDNNTPDVTITGISLMGKSLKMDSLEKLGTIELPHDQNSLAIQFSTLTYLTDYAIFYKMEGLDDDWKRCRSMPEVMYSYLPPGTYTFKTFCRNGNGRVSMHTTALRIKIRAPFWKTTWFLSLLAFLLIGILYWLDRLRMQKLRATESIRTRIATSLTEDLGSSLSSINLTSELAKTKVDTDKERTKEYINQISDTSHRMIDSMFDMIWSISPQHDSMEQMVERMKVFTTEMESIYDIDIVFDVDKAVYQPEPGMEHRYGLLVVFKEAVLNACRHSRGKHVYISLSYKNRKLLITVQDDGKGFDVDAVKLGRGINEMQRRASAMGAQLIIRSERNTGTIVQLEKHI